LIGGDPSSIFFLSGATEANNMVFASMTRGQKKSSRILTTTVEHSSIMKYCNYLMEQSVEIVLLPVDRQGRVSLDDISRAITDNTNLVSVQWVNNETGVIQPYKKLEKFVANGVSYFTQMRHKRLEKFL